MVLPRKLESRRLCTALLFIASPLRKKSPLPAAGEAGLRKQVG